MIALSWRLVFVHSGRFLRVVIFLLWCFLFNEFCVCLQATMDD